MNVELSINNEDTENCFLLKKSFNLNKKDELTSIIKYFKKLNDICNVENKNGFCNNNFNFYTILLNSNELNTIQCSNLYQALLHESINLTLLEPEYTQL